MGVPLPHTPLPMAPKNGMQTTPTFLISLGHPPDFCVIRRMPDRPFHISTPVARGGYKREKYALKHLEGRDAWNLVRAPIAPGA